MIICSQAQTNTEWLGSTIGRVSNRVKDGTFELDGTRYFPSANEGGNSLHGGAEGFSYKEWTGSQLGGQAAEFTLVSPAGDQVSAHICFCSKAAFAAILERPVLEHLLVEQHTKRMHINNIHGFPPYCECTAGYTTAC